VRAQRPRPTADCSDVKIESVIVTADGHRNPALDSAAAHVMYWFRPAESPDWQSATVPVAVGRARGVDVGAAHDDGGSAVFLTAAHDAVAAAAHEHAFDAFAPDSANATAALIVHFGHSVDARSSGLTRRHVCTASPLPDNPRPAFPAELMPELRSTQMMMSAMRTKTFTGGTVRAVFVVDTSGTVDPSTFHVLNATDPAFAREVRRVLPLMHYYPASINGRPASQAVEQQFTFDRA